MVNWKKVLIVIYNKAPDMFGFNKITGNLEFEKKVGMNTKKLDNCISLLDKIGLIKRWGIGPKTKITGNINPQTIKLPIELTRKGFGVALDLEKHKDSQKLHFGLLVFTGMIVITGAMQFIKEIVKISPSKMLFIYVLTFLILGLFGFIFMIKD